MREIKDIRYKDWINIDSKVSKLLKLLIEAEDILIDLDEYQMENDQIYPEIEDMMLQLGELRNDYSNFIDNNLDLLKQK